MTELLQPIQESTDLSPVTKRNYVDRVKGLTDRADKPIEHIITHPDTYIAKIKSWFPKPTSFRVYFSIVLGLFKYNPEFKAKHTAHHKKWHDAFKGAEDVVNERYESNEPTARQRQGYVPYAEIVKKRDGLPRGHMYRLLLGMYTHIKPMRCEYARVALYKGRLPEREKQEPNYINLSTGRLIIRHFKTRKHHDPYDIELPDALMTDLRKSLEEAPRDWLFVNAKGEPYTQSVYTHWTGRVFMEVFGKPLTVALIRHSFVNDIDFNAVSIQEKKEIAREMGHTVETQDRYRLLFNK